MSPPRGTSRPSSAAPTLLPSALPKDSSPRNPSSRSSTPRTSLPQRPASAHPGPEPTEEQSAVATTGAELRAATEREEDDVEDNGEEEEEDDDDEDDDENLESTQKQPLPPPPPPFEPFFTLVEDTTPSTTSSSTTHHPAVHYIFSDDDGDVLHDTLLRLASGPRPQKKKHPPGDPSLSQSQPGAKERCVLVTLGADGRSVAAAHSLTGDWQVVGVDISAAPMLEGGEGETGGLMLRVQGTEGIKEEDYGALGAGKDGFDAEAAIVKFRERVDELQRIVEAGKGLGGGVAAAAAAAAAAPGGDGAGGGAASSTV